MRSKQTLHSDDMARRIACALWGTPAGKERDAWMAVSEETRDAFRRAALAAQKGDDRG